MFLTSRLTLLARYTVPQFYSIRFTAVDVVQQYKIAPCVGPSLVKLSVGVARDGLLTCRHSTLNCSFSSSAVRVVLDKIRAYPLESSCTVRTADCESEPYCTILSKYSTYNCTCRRRRGHDCVLTDSCVKIGEAVYPKGYNPLFCVTAIAGERGERKFKCGRTGLHLVD